MNRAGLTVKQFRWVQKVVTGTHERDIDVQILDLNGKPKGKVDALIVEGQVTVDTSAQPITTLSIKFYDPLHKLAFDPRVSEAALHRKRMLRVADSRLIPANAEAGFPEARWVSWTVFVGPMTKVDREGALVTIAAVDKSSLAMDAAWLSRKFPEGTRKDRVLRELLSDAGETRMSVAKSKGTLGSALQVKKDSKRWLLVRKVAKSGGREAFYAGHLATVRRVPGKSQWTVPKQAVMSLARIDRSAERPPNTFQVIGGKPKGKNTKRIVSRPYYLPKSHPDNPRPGSGIGRNGKLRRNPKIESNDKIKSKKVANAKARGERNDVARMAVNVSVEIGPVPFLQPYDLLSVPTPDGTYPVRLHSFVLPLHPDGSPTMTLGTVRKVGVPVGRKRTGNKGGSGGRGGRGNSGGRDYAIVNRGLR